MKRLVQFKKLLALLVLLPFVFGFETLHYDTTISAWVPYWDLTGSTHVFQSHFRNTIDTLNMFVYVFDEKANIINICKDKKAYVATIQTLKKLRARIVPTITNDIHYSNGKSKLKDAAILHRIFTNPSLRRQHIQQIFDITEELNAPGVDIDYENINIRDKGNFSRFIQELAEALHAHSKTLSVIVEQKTRDHQRSGPGAVNWKEISRYADRITIMCYNYSSRLGRPGPICPSYWLKKIIRFARTQIPQEKISIALPLHGYDWNKKKTISVNALSARALINKYNAKLRWHSKSASPYFVYYADGIRHQVWFENKRSIAAKIKIINRYRIAHLAFWHLGILDPTFKGPLQEFID